MARLLVTIVRLRRKPRLVANAKVVDPPLMIKVSPSEIIPPLLFQSGFLQRHVLDLESRTEADDEPGNQLRQLTVRAQDHLTLL